MADQASNPQESEEKNVPVAHAKTQSSPGSQRPVKATDSDTRRSAEIETAPDIPVSDLVARSDQFLGVPSYVAAGALYGQEGDMSIDDAVSMVDEWLNNEIATPQEG